MVITRSVVLRFCNLVTFILVLVISGLGFRFPFGTHALVSGEPSSLDDSVPHIVVWVIVFGTMLVFVVYQLLPRTYRYEYINHGITPYFIVQCMIYSVGGIVHICLVKTSPYMEVITLTVVLMCQVISYLTVSSIIARNLVEEEGSDDHFYLNYCFGRAWLSLHLAWIACSLLGNGIVAISKMFSFNYIVSIIAFCGMGLFTLIFLFKEHDALFGAVVVWESVWLAISTYAASEAGDGTWYIFISVVVVGSVVGLATIATLIRNILYLIERAKQRQVVPLRKNDALP
ncbi:hypothetical protein DSO57_1010593 [Entomophthora muscae]|uniref:Uncharacterized protein n=1 Tax=Entomophthora muscae TaxID=34485 RepID=A0ACC2UHC3_9FUNG|nr:hypothetical protein DSO57_1010593 [Entomophthora muscae]